MPQPLKDIEERIELLKMTLGMFAPSEPVPVADELVQLGEEIFEHALMAAGETPVPAPAGDERLLALHAQGQRADAGLAPLAATCRTLLDLRRAVAGSPDDPEVGQRLLGAAEAVAELYSAVTTRPSGSAR
jgi:hypothetical protein